MKECNEALNQPLAAFEVVLLQVCKYPKLPIGAGGAVLVAQPFRNGQRLAIPLLRRTEVPLLCGDPSQLVIGDGSAVLVAQPFLNGQRLVIPLLRRTEVPLLFGDPSQLVIGAGAVLVAQPFLNG